MNSNNVLAKYLAESEAWRKRYPQHCKSCSGQGILRVYDSVPVPFGPGNCLMETDEPCSDCLQHGKCPRCGEIITSDDNDFDCWYNDELPCPHCGWSWGKHESDYDPSLLAPDPDDNYYNEESSE